MVKTGVVSRATARVELAGIARTKIIALLQLRMVRDAGDLEVCGARQADGVKRLGKSNAWRPRPFGASGAGEGLPHEKAETAARVRRHCCQFSRALVSTGASRHKSCYPST